ncbi:MAG TPA: EthD domain-containing protein [Casimicrobiaceae bacterium]|nr:EthD domain-containing protein [Casimicrobiaceae bacterium]
MHKVFTFIKARAGIDRPALRAWWLEPPHAKLAAGVPGLHRYTASLEADGADAPFDGVAEMWFDTVLEDAVAIRSAAGGELDATLRAHAARTEQIHVVEHKFVDTGRPAPFKLIAALKRRSDMTRGEFASWWLERHAPLVVVFPELRRYSVNIVVDEDERFVDGVAEVAFADLETLKRITGSAQVKGVQGDSQAHTSARYRLLAQEFHIIR